MPFSRKISQAAKGLIVPVLGITFCILWNVASASAVGSDEIPFRKQNIDLGRSESVTVADINRDGRLDIVSGENWFEQAPRGKGDEGPRWIKHHFRDLPFTDGYIADLSDLAIDVDGDGYPDVISCSYWEEPLTWWKNPGKENKPWQKVVIQEGAPVEFVFLVDVTNSGQAKDLLPQFGDEKFGMSWYELTGKGRDAKWERHIVDEHSYGHGIGMGDINKDGRNDIITPKGWFEAPADPRNGKWIFHQEFDLGSTGFIHVRDVNGDGLPDLVTSIAHAYGILWFEQKLNADGSRTWTKHVIDDAWSQGHATTLADLTGNGAADIVTGKRYYAHEHDPGAAEPLGVYWYEPVQSRGRLQWIRHVIDYSTRAGGGMQIPVVDIDGDGDLDIVVAGKSGLYLFENLTINKQQK
ncbi:MAG TPA: VCBS repeat-containing protein [Terriglobales bacterium]|nr:VCBS repeat-containing protein [Terriglobales bacterium]